MSKIRFKLKPIDDKTDLVEWTKNKGFFTIEIGKTIKLDMSKQSSFKKWSSQWKRRSEL
jgi:hypothetical protein